MSDIETMLAQIAGLRAEIHEWRKEDKSEHVSLASRLGVLEAWQNRQAGAWALVALVMGVFGAVIIKGVTTLMSFNGKGG